MNPKQQYVRGMWTGLTWLRLGSIGSRFSTYYSTFRVHTWCSWVVEGISAVHK